MKLLERIFYPFVMLGYMFMCFIVGFVMLIGCFGIAVPAINGLLTDPSQRTGYILALIYGASIIGGGAFLIRLLNPNYNWDFDRA